jgi:DNA (cytosine-5)-methyltransferase 1
MVSDSPSISVGPGRLRAAEFFAGIGLVRLALDAANVEVVWANDIDAVKQRIYAANWGENDFVLGDVARTEVGTIPTVDLATASFPCTDLSVAGGRRGLAGSESGAFWPFVSVLEELRRDDRLPPAVMCENVIGFATSNGGEDLRSAVEALNRLGYHCDILVADARWWVAQSRPRLFVVGLLDPPETRPTLATSARPPWLSDFWRRHPSLLTFQADVELPARAERTLADALLDLPLHDPAWWDQNRLTRFRDSLSFMQTDRALQIMRAPDVTWRTAYRRTRDGVPRWEIRADDIAGCLRTARGGSSKQAVMRAGRGEIAVRWMLPEEYAALQGASGYRTGDATGNQALYGFGDAVCVPAVQWVVENCITPFITPRQPAVRAAA